MCHRYSHLEHISKHVCQCCLLYLSCRQPSPPSWRGSWTATSPARWTPRRTCGTASSGGVHACCSPRACSTLSGAVLPRCATRLPQLLLLTSVPRATGPAGILRQGHRVIRAGGISPRRTCNGQNGQYRDNHHSQHHSHNTLLGCVIKDHTICRPLSARLCPPTLMAIQYYISTWATIHATEKSVKYLMCLPRLAAGGSHQLRGQGTGYQLLTVDGGAEEGVQHLPGPAGLCQPAKTHCCPGWCLALCAAQLASCVMTILAGLHCTLESGPSAA
jgi:hypothetical protein